MPALKIRYWLIALGILVIMAGIANATLMSDDLFLIERFPKVLNDNGFARSLGIFFLGLDTGGREYRLYGLSKVFHFLIWECVGKRAWVYGGLIAGTQYISGLGIHRLLTRLEVENFQAWAVALVWILSPFAVTTCFHYYSYLLLPYQLTIGLALTIQSALKADAMSWYRYLAIIAIALAVANTGESHFPAALLIFGIVAFATPSTHSRRVRCILVALAITTIATSIILNRILWLTYVPYSEAQRYNFAAPNLAEGIQRTAKFLCSLPYGAQIQIGPLLTFAGHWGLLTAVPIALIGVFLYRMPFMAQKSTGNAFCLPAVLCLVTLASLVVLWTVGTLSGQINDILFRRYGFVPYTLSMMTVTALLSAPDVRRWIGHVPGIISVSAIAWLWLTLVAVCLPIVRKQDQEVWSSLERAIHEKSDPAVIFASASNFFGKPHFNSHAGVRGVGFPGIFESPLSGYIWEAYYSVVVLGARTAFYRLDRNTLTKTRLAGQTYPGNSLTVVPRDFIVVVADMGLHPPNWRKREINVTIFTRWNDFAGSPASLLGK